MICYVRLCKTLKDTAELEEHVLVLHLDFLYCSCFRLPDLLSIDWRKHLDDPIVRAFINFTLLSLRLLDFTYLNFTHLNFTLIILTTSTRRSLNIAIFPTCTTNSSTNTTTNFFDHPTSKPSSIISTMSHPSNNNTNRSIPLHTHRPITASGSISTSQNNDMSLSSNKQINGTSSLSHQINNVNTISSLRQSHQSITPTPLRQNTTAASLGQTNEPVTTASSTAPFAQHKKNTSSSSLRQIDGISISHSNSTAASPSSPSSSSYNNQIPKRTPTSSDPRHQNTKSMGNQPTGTNNKQTSQPHYSTPKKSSKRPYVDPRYDPNLTLAQRLEASTNRPLAPYSDYEWKMENEYESLTSWQPPIRKSEEWKWKGP
jgi:hypothetical protein